MIIDPFLYWMREREAVRLRRKSGHPPPWTAEPILQTYRFCNVRREDDRVTVWIRQHIREPYADHPALWWMLCAARMINWPDSLAEIIAAGAWPDRANFNPAQIGEVLEARKLRGDKVETGAYMISASYKTVPSWSSWSKQRYIAEIVLGRLWDKREEVSATLEAKHAFLTEHRGWGPFMAWQAVADMCFTSILAAAPDRHSWAAAGPGTIRGLNRLHERPVKQTLSQKKALAELRDVYPILLKESGIEFDWIDVMNIMCETDKFLRVKNGEGRPRSLFTPLLT
jgi:hypothetical protein